MKRRMLFGNSLLPANTFIGGIGATINTPALLATKLGIDSHRVSNFTLIGMDISCAISGSYTIPINCFQNTNLTDSSPTYYRDEAGLVTSIGDFAFYNSLKTVVYFFPNATSIGIQQFYHSSFTGLSPIVSLYIPRCVALGVTVNTDESMFSANYRSTKLYISDYLRTVNAGSPDQDLVIGAGIGVDISYVTNFTAPSPVTDLSVGTIYNTAIQLNFTVPSSVNAIDYYEVYANGIFTNNIKGSGEYAMILTPSTSYNIIIIAVDVFYNKSVVSNTLSQSTNTTSAKADAIPSLVSYYKLNSNSNDGYGSNNGVDTSISYVSGKIGNAGSFNGTSSKIEIPYNSSLDMVGNPSFSINLWVKFTSIKSCEIICASNGTSRIWEIYYETGMFVFRINNGTTTSIRMERYFTITPSTGTWYMLTFTYDGSAIVSGMKMYLNNSEVGSTRTIGGTYSAIGSNTNPIVIGTFPGYTPYTFNGLIDEVAIYKTHKLTPTEITLLYNSGAGITL